MRFYIRVKVKFRAFLTTFAEWDRRFEVTIDGKTVDFRQVEVEVPSGARVVIDRNGVKVNVWS